MGSSAQNMLILVSRGWSILLFWHEKLGWVELGSRKKESKCRKKADVDLWLSDFCDAFNTTTLIFIFIV